MEKAAFLQPNLCDFDGQMKHTATVQYRTHGSILCSVKEKQCAKGKKTGEIIPNARPIVLKSFGVNHGISRLGSYRSQLLWPEKKSARIWTSTKGNI